MTFREMGTYYIPEGQTRTITFPALREGNNESQILVTDDRDTLMAPAFVEEADTDSMLMLKQFGAGRLIEKLRMMAQYEGLEPGDTVEIYRGENRYEAEMKTVRDAADAME